MATKRFLNLLPGGKSPVIKWKKEPEKLFTEDEVKHYNDVAYAPLHGEVVVDADDEEHTAKIELLISKLGMQVFSYPTTRGKHFLFRMPDSAYYSQMGNNIKGTIFMSHETWKSEIDVKGNDKGYVVIKKSGKERVSAHTLLEEFAKAPMCPVLLLLPSPLHMSFFEYQHHGRDMTVFKWIPKLRLKGMIEEEFVKLCVELKFLNDDPETVEETISWARQKWQSSISMGEVKEYVQESIDYRSLSQKEKNEAAEEIEIPDDMETVHKTFQKSAFVDKKTKEMTWMISGIKDYSRLSKFIITSTNLQVSRDDGQIWGNDGNGFGPVVKLGAFLKRFMNATFGNIKPSVVNDIESYITGSIPVKSFSQNDFLINFTNVIFDLRQNTTVSLGKDEMLQNVIPHRYIPKEEWSPRHREMEKQLLALFNEWTLNDPKLMKQILVRIGISMTKYMGLEKAVFILGDSSNGKTIFLNALVKLLGTQNCAHEDLKELTEDKFSSSNLYSMLANINFDISAEIMNDTSLFKRLISGDRISASYKGQDKFRFSPYAKFFLGANNIPYTRELGESDAVTRRLEVWPFDNKFKKNVERDIAIKELLTQEEFYEVFITMAIHAAHDALSKNDFAPCRRSRKKLEEYNRETNPLFNFIEEDGIKHNEPAITTYARYKRWCERYGFVTFGYQQFIKKLRMTSKIMGNKIAIETFDEVVGAKRHRVIEVGRFEGNDEEQEEQDA